MSLPSGSKLDLLGSVFNHLVLPPEIPGAQDSHNDAIARNILTRMIHATDTAISLTSDIPWREEYQNLQESLRACLELNGSRLERSKLLKHLQKLDRGKMLILYLKEQNAGLLIRRDKKDDGDHVVFESFEASATSCEVLAAGHAMEWDFPGRSAYISLDDFTDSFQECLALFLEQANMESLYYLRASAKKAGVSIGEIRDTTDPALITQMLMSLLEAVGGHHQAPILRKRIRDDVNLANTTIPWRRLPIWLVLRVAAQRQLCFTLGGEQGKLGYKFLMAILLAELLDDSAAILSPHKVVCLRAKLARRMAKLEMEPGKFKLGEEAACNTWFIAASAVVRNSIENANMQVESAWDSFKKSTTRYIPRLPRRAPLDSLELTLPNSGRYLDEIIHAKSVQTSTLGSLTLPNPLDKSIQRSQQLTAYAFNVAALEQRIEQNATQQKPNANQTHEDRCLELASQIEDVFDAVGSTYKDQIKDVFNTRNSAYDLSPEQNSAMILALFTLWVDLDKSAVTACQLLADHAPIFHPELLDALQLPTKLAMERLQRIQGYLADRHASSFYGNMFETHKRDSFALRYIARSKRLESLERRIQENCTYARQQKQEELELLCDEYDEHTEAIFNNPCLCWLEDGEKKSNGCVSCYHERVRNKMKISVHEAFLPEDDAARGTIIFELGIPGWLSAYRDATWYILSELAHPYKPKNAEKAKIHLQDYKPLRSSMTARIDRLSLASKIKSFEQTHYLVSKVKVSPMQIFVPFAPHFQLYDSASNVWIGDLTNPLTLEHLCGIQIPGCLLSLLPKRLHPPTTVDGPSSYEIQANQAVAPSDIPIQAFSAYQKLISGKRRRWPNILIEMSSSNLNLSDENTKRVICQVALQAGPRLPSESLRAVHEVFKYPVFTTRLIKILEQLLESIRGNWREHNIMELVVTLALRLYSLSDATLGIDILKTARNCLTDWISDLRKKLHDTTDSVAAQRYATYGIHAALLCRETFATFIGSQNCFSQEDLSAWIQASIAVQENTLHDLSRLSDIVRGLLLRDAEMTYHLQNHVKSAMTANRAVVGAEILRGWSSQLSDSETRPSWTFLSIPHNHWIVANTLGRFPEIVHFNYIEGHLLVNGKPRAKLPLEIADDKAVNFIFGAQHLLTFPSRQPGMSHRLARTIEGHEVNFGLRNGCAVIRATRYNPKSREREIQEFVPGWRLSKSGSFDLPAELVLNCGHWLNINTQRLEIRRGLPNTPAFWSTRPRDWFVDVPLRRAFRGVGGSQLVDPHSATFSRIAGIFRHFEQPEKLTVFQPLNDAANLTVELKHLDLHFEVNKNHLLQCQQLAAEIDPDQDAGTWYGLSSKIVMREMNSRNRSIIVPLGKPIVRHNDPHVDVRIQGTSHYASFKIDSILGRLSCSPEPRIIYAKALYHAITSFCLPDKLTGQTGSSEAFAILQSGAAQPWTPVTQMTNIIFAAFHDLVPRREYYPPGIKRFQKVHWDPDLTSSIQYDGYGPLIEAIKQKSNNLEIFSIGSRFESIEISHLCHRGRAQRKIYDPLVDIEISECMAETSYTPRDRRSGAEAARVYQISRVILSHCLQFHMDTTLESILESFEIIGGFSALGDQRPTLYAGPLKNQIEDPIHEKWGDIVEFCRRSSSKFALLFRLGLLAFNGRANMDIIHFLAAVGLINKLKDCDPPQHQYFANYQSRGRPSVDFLEALIQPTYPKFQPMESKQQGNGLIFSTNKSLETEHIELCRQEGFEIAQKIQRHWPMSTDQLTLKILEEAIDKPHQDHPRMLIDIKSAWDKIKPEWQRRLANVELSDYITRVDEVLLSLSLCGTKDATIPVPWRAKEPDFIVTHRSFTYQSVVRDWISKCGPTSGMIDGSLLDVIGEHAQQTTYLDRSPSIPFELVELDKILMDFEKSENDLRKRYGRDLRRSFTAFEDTAKQPELRIMNSVPDFPALNAALEYAKTRVRNIQIAIATACALHDSRNSWLEIGAIRPISTATGLLKLLRSTASLEFGPGMKQAIVSYGLAITYVQHLDRIHRALSRKNFQALHDELRHLGHENWEPIKVPDWLLLEIDSDMLIRAEQVVVARAIIDPQLGNGVLQLSMGKGKTSCIIPMVEAVLANGQNLSRVIVPKSLIMQTAQTMQSRLGGLVGREVTHIPYSRRTSTRQEALDLYAGIHHETRQRHGVMLTCAEHLLSHKLFGWQKFVDLKRSTADQMIRFQKWLDTHCRDVLDECDFTLSVKTQLNYPSGPQMPIDFHPYRWKIAQELLGLAASHIQELRRKHPRGIQVTSRRAGENFPSVQFLRTDAEDALHEIIIESTRLGHLTLLRPILAQSKHQRNTIREVLRGKKINDKLLDRAAHLFENPDIAKNALLFVRGLVLYRILVLCLGKRWNVQYGLHPDRDPIAVPYEAKGKPSEQAEYGHPDVAILFTCLSFYYAGLTQDQLVQGMQTILQSNDPAAQYEWWTSTCIGLPISLRHWNLINADDKGQMEKLWHLLRLNRNVIDHYMNHFVFPIHAKQFEIKLQACSWDIPIFSETETQLTRTTGFSGTNDNRFMLPLTISQRDLPELQHTSAEVLSYLLQKRNRGFHVIANEQGHRLTEIELLRDLKARKISVLIDVGAYISEMGNNELANAWLEVDSDAKAVIYFGNDNRAWVHYRSNAKVDVPLLATPLAEDLSDCNVFLDEGHTRGVDLRLPTNANGAVTLALKLTKDHTVQAAMRLRQLRTTQSICFYGPPEVDQSIRDFGHLDALAKIDSSHVVAWLLEQTCRSVEDLQGLYVAQGIDFCQRTDTIWHCKDFKTNYSQRQTLLRVLRQPERKSLHELYGPTAGIPSISPGGKRISKQLGPFMNKLVRIGHSQQGKIQAGALEEVEQEREVEAQVEQVRQVEKRTRYAALKYPGIHSDIMQFARTGTLIASRTDNTAKPGFEHAFAFVGKTTVAKRFSVHETSSKFFISAEFANTVQVARNSQESENFLRPVEWIVWCPKTETALVVIPEEAEHLMEVLRDREGKPCVHLIAYAAPITKAMIHFNNLEFYSFPELPKGHTIPESIRIELGILSGRLYVNQSEWEGLMNYMRVSKANTANDLDKIATNPAAFLLEWLAIRRKTVDVLHTPMGFICTGREMEKTGSLEVVDDAELGGEGGKEENLLLN